MLVFRTCSSRSLSKIPFTDKAAQAAAQAAQNTALQAQSQPQPVAVTVPQMTGEQALQLLQRLGLAGLLESQNGSLPTSGSDLSSSNNFGRGGYDHEEKPRFMSGMMEPRQNRLQKESNFSPFSPDPNLYDTADLVPRNYAPGSGFGSFNVQETKVIGDNGKISPPSVLRPPNGIQRFGNSYLDDSRRYEPISRPTSGTPTGLESKQYDPISDLNGTLASLDLDQSTWKSSGGNHYDAFAQYRATGSPTNRTTPSP